MQMKDGYLANHQQDDVGEITVWFYSGEEPDEAEVLTEITYT